MQQKVQYVGTFRWINVISTTVRNQFVKQTSKKDSVICISRRHSFAWLPALALYLYLPALTLNLYLPVLDTNLYLPALTTSLQLPALAPNLCLPILAPNLYLPALVYNFIASPRHEFCIYRPYLLNLCLYLRPWPTICITGLGLNFHLPCY